MILKPHVNITGTGPNLALIHGWGLHGGIWNTLLPQLEKKFTIYNIDLPGFGRSAVHDGLYNLDYLVESVAVVIPDSCYLLGWSLGGLVATGLALKRPNCIKKLITVASNPSFVADEQWQYGMQANALKSFMKDLEQDYEGTVLRFLGVQTMGSATQKEDLKQLKASVFTHGQPAPKALRGGLQILYETNLIDQLKQLTMPLLGLYGRFDSLVPAKVASDVTQHLPKSEVIIYRQSAHAPFLSARDAFIRDVTAFLFGSQEELALFKSNGWHKGALDGP